MRNLRLSCKNVQDHLFATSKFEVLPTRIVITLDVNCSDMANSRRMANLEENQKLDDALVERLAKIIAALQNIED